MHIANRLFRTQLSLQLWEADQVEPLCALTAYPARPAASQALLLNKELEDRGVIEKITDESGLKVVGKEARDRPCGQLLALQAPHRRRQQRARWSHRAARKARGAWPGAGPSILRLVAP